MTLNDCVELANECGLETFREALDNIHLHATMLFIHTELSDELDELEGQFRTSGHDLDDYI